MKNGRPRKNPPKFPAIDRAILDRGGVVKFCTERYYSCSSYYLIQQGRRSPSLPLILDLLDYTGLTFDEAFLDKPKGPAQELREKNIPARAGTTKPGKNRKERIP